MCIFSLTSIKRLLQEIHDNVTDCPQLLSESTGLQLLNIEGVDTAALFTDFVDMDAFCGKRGCLFIYIHYFVGVNTFSYTAILPCGHLVTKYKYIHVKDIKQIHTKQHYNQETIK